MIDFSKLKYKRVIVATSLVLNTRSRPIWALALGPNQVTKYTLPPEPGIYSVGINVRVDLADPWAEIMKTQRKALEMLDFKRKKLSEFPFFSQASAQWKLVIKDDFSIEVLGKAKLGDQKQKLYKAEGLKVGLGIPFVKGSELSVDLIDQADSNQTVHFDPSQSDSSVSIHVLARHDKLVLIDDSYRILFDVAKPKKPVPPKPEKLSFKTVSFVIGPFETNSAKTGKMDAKAAKKASGAIDGAGLTKKIKAMSDATKEMYESGNRPSGFKNIVIKGFADTRGTEGHNRNLGMDRAKAVKKHIQTDLGASDHYFSPLSKGEGPKPNKDSEKGEDNPMARVVTVDMMVVK